MIEFLTAFVLLTGCLEGSYIFFFVRNSTRDNLAVVHQVLIDWNHPMTPSFSKPPVLYPAPVLSTIHGSRRQRLN